MKRIGIIGCGLIGAPVIQAVQSGRSGEWSIAAILSRTRQSLNSITSVVEADDFFSQRFDLIIDTASPSVLQTHGVRALSAADLWTVNASVLADAVLLQALEETGRLHGHRLRVVTGAVAGLDGVATASTDDNAEVTATIDVAPTPTPRETLFTGSAREAAKAFPESVNVAIAASLAGTGLDRTQVEVVQPSLDEGRKLTLRATSRHGHFEATSVPKVVPREIHTAAASIVAALRREDEVIWVG